MQIRPNIALYNEDYLKNGSIMYISGSETNFNYPYMHCHSEIELGYVTSGSGVFTIGDRSTPVSEGDFTIALPNEIHIGNSLGAKKSRWSYIIINASELYRDNPDMLIIINRMLYADDGIIGQVITKGAGYCYDYISRMFSEASEKNENYIEIIKALLIAFMYTIKREQAAETAKTGNIRRNISAVLPALSYISAHYSEDLSVAQLAGLCYMSRTNFRRTFKNIMSVSPSEHIYRLRITAAMAMLKGHGVPVTDIACSVGYNSISSFHRHFKRITGMSPREYRVKNHL